LSYRHFLSIPAWPIPEPLCNINPSCIVNNMNSFLLITTFFLLSPIILIAQTRQFQAKRAAPKQVADIRYESTILQRSGMEYVQALDSATKKVLWKKKVYDVIYIPNLETDVQDVFIDSMYLSDKYLIIRNEKRLWFSLDLQTLETKRIKPHK
jgi:hypothetical protein